MCHLGEPVETTNHGHFHGPGRKVGKSCRVVMLVVVVAVDVVVVGVEVVVFVVVGFAVVLGDLRRWRWLD